MSSIVMITSSPTAPFGKPTITSRAPTGALISPPSFGVMLPMVRCGVAVLVGVDVAVAVGVGVPVDVSVTVAVGVGVPVGVSVAVALGVEVAVDVDVGVQVGGSVGIGRRRVN